MNMKQSALGGGSAGASAGASKSGSAKGGYQLWHILSVAVVSLLIGALIRQWVKMCWKIDIDDKWCMYRLRLVIPEYRWSHYLGLIIKYYIIIIVRNIVK